jgi:hypothetical protein
MWPNGASMGLGRHALSYEDAVQLTKEAAPDVHRLLLENALKEKPGPRNGNELTASTRLIDRNHKSRTRQVLSIRLAQEYPKYYEGWMRGEYRSVTAAATAAGLLKNDVNLRRAKSAFRKMTVDERKEFLKWIKTL